MLEVLERSGLGWRELLVNLIWRVEMASNTARIKVISSKYQLSEHSRIEWNKLQFKDK